MAVFNKYFMNTNFFFLSPSIASFVGLICLNEDKNRSDKLLLCKCTRRESNTCLKYLSCGAEHLARRLQTDPESEEAMGISPSPSPRGCAGTMQVLLEPKKGPRRESEQMGSFDYMIIYRRRGEDISRFYLILREASNVFFAVRARLCLCPDHGEVLS